MTDGAPGAGSVALATPGLARRLACFVYEGVLLFGVLMISGYLYSSLSQQRNALHGRHGLQAFLFVVLGIYFVWFWSHGGQTVAMKAWHIRLLRRDGTPLTQARALARYLLAWLWFMPALLALWLAGSSGLGTIGAALLVGVLGYAALAWLDRDRQFLHDRLCGTRLVDWHPDATARDRARGTGQNRAP
jgi:uncharacterized RDD family membrane protein YckC